MIQGILRMPPSNVKLLKSGLSLLSSLLPMGKWYQPMVCYVRSIHRKSTKDLLVKNIADPPKRAELISYFMKVLSCEKSIATQIFNEVPELNGVQLADFKKIVDMLLLENMTVAALVDNPFILSMPKGLYFLSGEKFSDPKPFKKQSSYYNFASDQFQLKLSILHTMNPRDIHDFMPLLRIPLKDLERMRRKYIDESGTLPEGHRVYYFSKVFEVNG